MKAENTAIKLLSLSALILLLALIFLPGKQATAETTTGNADMLACTYPSTNGDALYILDIRAQVMIALVFNGNTRTLEPKAVQALQ